MRVIHTLISIDSHVLGLPIGGVSVVSGDVEGVFLGLIEFLAMGRCAVCGNHNA